MLLVAGCASLPSDYERPHSVAVAPSYDARLARMLELEQGTGNVPSRFLVLDRGDDALLSRLALTDAADTALDLQYFVWREDATADLLLSRLLVAADRGVRVRILVDDIHLRGGSVNPAVIAQHPNIEIRIFNPLAHRTAVRMIRWLELAFNLRRLNQRMHNKLFVADNLVAIVGGRNIGNEYFGFNPELNQRDMDLLATGPVVPEIASTFDEYWNSQWAVPPEAFFKRGRQPSLSDLAELREEIREFLESQTELDAAFGLDERDWIDEARQARNDMIPGDAWVIYDDPPDLEDQRPRIRQIDELSEIVEAAETEVLAVSPYVIPHPLTLEAIRELTERGVRVRLLTNSLASNNLTIANSAYKRYRRALLEAGTELYELRSDPADRALYETSPVVADRIGLHAKVFIVDRETTYVGTLNLDPRSFEINTEIGVVVRSPPLAETIQSTFERDMRPDNSWRVEIDEDGRLRWTSTAGVKHIQPAHSFTQRLADFFLQMLPVEQQL